MSIKVLKGGLLTTVQDLGRFSYQRFGMSVAGAMDGFSVRIANMLVGNEPSEGALEATYIGPTLEFMEGEVIAITGGHMEPSLNERPVPMWCSIKVGPGDVLSFKGAKAGLRSYIAFSRKLDIPLVMGSRSTFTRGGIGGLNGRKLQDGDRIGFREGELSVQTGSYLKKAMIPAYRKEETIRVVLGPQDDHFPQKSLDLFLESEYTITNQADRMGYRLEGEKLVHRNGPDIISDGVVFGSIQVPGHGRPIIIMADRATTGGYAKIATVISPDLPRLAQMPPGSRISFSRVSVKEAADIYRESHKYIEEIRSHIDSCRFNFDRSRSMDLRVNGKSYGVDVREIL